MCWDLCIIIPSLFQFVCLVRHDTKITQVKKICDFCGRKLKIFVWFWHDTKITQVKKIFYSCGGKLKILECIKVFFNLMAINMIHGKLPSLFQLVYLVLTWHEVYESKEDFWFLCRKLKILEYTKMFVSLVIINMTRE